MASHALTARLWSVWLSCSASPATIHKPGAATTSRTINGDSDLRQPFLEVAKQGSHLQRAANTAPSPGEGLHAMHQLGGACTPARSVSRRERFAGSTSPESR